MDCTWRKSKIDGGWQVFGLESVLTTAIKNNSPLPVVSKSGEVDEVYISETTRSFKTDKGWCCFGIVANKTELHLVERIGHILKSFKSDIRKIVKGKEKKRKRFFAGNLPQYGNGKPR